VTKERFEALAEAYGGDIARWPADVRDAAAVLMTAEPEFAQGVLGRESGLDAALDGWPRPTPSRDLIERIVATAPRPRPRRTGWLMPLSLGAGLAAACAAGLIVGVHLSSQLRDPAPPSVADAFPSAVLEEEA
jgi:hypothetical protein